MDADADMDAALGQVSDFAVQVRRLCAKLADNPFRADAAEALVDLLIDHGPGVDVALRQLLTAVSLEPAARGSEILAQLARAAA